jgi:hypothetical protein
MNQSIFDVINWILKKPNKNLDLDEKCSTYLLNRWLSMASQENSNIVNETINRWYHTNSIYNDTFLISKFFRNILPKFTKKINYLKKNNNKKEKSKNEDCFEHMELEISKREYLEQKRLIEELNKLNK